MASAPGVVSAEEAINKTIGPTYTGGPTLYVDNSSYNFIVEYKWEAPLGSELEISYNGGTSFIKTGSQTYTEYSYPYNYLNTDMAKPDVTAARSYNLLTGYATGATTTEHNEEGESDIFQHTVYGWRTKYKAVNGLSRTQITDQDIPTKYDQNLFIWNHNGSKGDTIVASVKYKNYIADLEVKIPGSLTTKTDDVMLGDYKFQIRTGHKRCSIRVNKAGMKAYDVIFVFGVRKKT